jgi:DNA-binding SARP family transcriptional activator
MPAFTLLLLGPVRVIGAASGEATSVGAKAAAMLAYLATQPGREAEREVLANLLWEGVGARHALRQTLLVLRRGLDQPTGLIRSDASAVSLAPGVVTDLSQFESLLMAGRVEAACSLWRGPFCAGLESSSDRFEDWLALERARLEENAAGAFGELARQAEAEGRMDVAITAAQRLVALTPFDDAAQATLIALYRRRGWPEAARLTHRRCVGLFHRELGIAPDARVQAAAQAPVATPRCLETRRMAEGPRRAWRRWLVAAALMLSAGLVWHGWLAAPMQAEAAQAAWVSVDEWRPETPLETRGLPVSAAIARGLAGDPEFAHLTPGGC